MTYRYLGYYDRRPEKRFSFLIPIFKKGKHFFRQEIDLVEDRIEQFTKYSDKFKEDNDNKVNKTEHERGLFMFRFGNNIEFGDKTHVALRLIRLLTENQLLAATEYDISCFSGVPYLIERSIQRIIDEYDDNSLTFDNFYIPDRKELSLQKYSECLYHFSQLLDYKKTLNLEGLFFISSKNKQPNVSRFALKSSSNPEKDFDSLIVKYKSKKYRDLVVHSFRKAGYTKLLSKKEEFRLRELVNIKPLSKKDIVEDQDIYRNSQSRRSLEENAIIKSSKVEFSISETSDLGPSKINEIDLKEITQIKNQILKQNQYV